MDAGRAPAVGEAALIADRGAPLLAALAQRLPRAGERAAIAATLAEALATAVAERTPTVEAVAETARLQEVGKLYVPRELLNRPAGELTAAERAELDSYYEHGGALARGAGVPDRACSWILHARERWDGDGPGGLSAAEIPLGSRVIAVTREYLDAPLQPGAAADPMVAALWRLGAVSGTALDPELATAAIELATDGAR